MNHSLTSIGIYSVLLSSPLDVAFPTYTVSLAILLSDVSFHKFWTWNNFRVNSVVGVSGVTLFLYGGLLPKQFMCHSHIHSRPWQVWWLGRKIQMLVIQCVVSYELSSLNLLLHFAWVVDDAKCIVVTRVCVSVRGRTPTLLHGPGCDLGAWLEAAS